MTHEALCEQLRLTDEDSIEALRRRLIAMARDGQIHSNRRQGYGALDRLDLIRGRVQGHRDGFGFVIPADGSDDLYLAFRQMQKVFDGDEVLVRVSGKDYKGRREAAIVEVLAHNTHQVVGRLACDAGAWFVRPDNPRITHDLLVPADKLHGATEGQFVVVAIDQQPGGRGQAVGHILEVLGDHMAPGMEIDVAIRSAGIPHMWPTEVQAEARKLPVEVAEADKQFRVDLRQLPFVTIDGEDARDFDDAVYCEAKKGGGWRLYVAIADVSHYVQIGSALDHEAQQRGTSVYFPDFVVPMLPEALSNGLCSLNPQVDRLCMVCEMTISAAGRISGYHFYEGIIHSHARLTYTQVGQALAEKAAATAGKGRVRKVLEGILPGVFRPAAEAGPMRLQLSAVVPQIDELHRLYQVLRLARDERGAIDFETTETRILFDANRKIERIVPVVRNDAHKLIEECMLAANVCAARFLEKHDVPGLYRVHEGPKAEKLENLRTFLSEIGLTLPGGDKPEPANYQKLLQSIAGRPDAHLIQTVMLRSLSQAMYQPDNKGHFGLGYTAYAHFTSPIRRYPDLLVHRAIRSVVRSNLDTKLVKRVEGATALPKNRIYPYAVGDMLRFGEQSSMAERRADEATRDVVSWLKCEFLQERVGDTFPGVVTAATGFGLFVELKELFVEGLVHVTSLPHDYYHFEPAHHRLVGERTRTTFRLGDQVVVRVVRVNLDERKVDFELIEHIPLKQKKTSRKAAAPQESRAPRSGGRGAAPAKAAAGAKSGAKSGAGRGRAKASAPAKPRAETPPAQGADTARPASKSRKRPSRSARARKAKAANKPE
jgi:ribonuclease R